MRKIVNVVTLGCSKNVVDSEHIAAQLAADGWKIDFDGESPDAGVVVVNTCGFIGDAKEESIDMIMRCAAARSAGTIDRLYVIGCLSERYRDELRPEIPEVDEFFGARDLTGVVNELVGPWREELRNERVLSTPAHYAYLKISEGCDRACAYCAIPLIRGRHVSVPMEDLLDEARRLAQRGVRELIVIAQDTTYYGLDLYGERRVAQLLRELCRIEGIEWIRLHYAYPAGFPDDLIAVIRDEPKVCRYLDIPLQHISDNVLRSMKRGLGGKGTRQLLTRLRAEIPDLAIRTTMLVGHPGESEQDFQELLDFVREAEFERLGVFPYCEEEGTYSAKEFTDDVPESVKHERADRLMALQNEIATEKNRGMIGKTCRVVIDGLDGDYYVARTEYDSPEVDQQLLIPAAGNEALTPGMFVEVTITDASDYDLFGQIYRL